MNTFTPQSPTRPPGKRGKLVAMTKPDYTRLIDAETWAFIARTNDFYPPDAVALDIAGQRAVYDRMAQAFHAGRPEGVVVTDLGIAGVACRRYAPRPDPGATVIWYHGGGFVVGGLESHDDLCAEIAAATGFAVLAVDYRLSPEHPHPAAFDDALAVARATQGPVILAGDSAGGNLAAAVALALRGEVAPLGLLLVYPGLGGPRDRGSMITHADAPMLRRADVLYYADIRHGGAEPMPDPSFAPLSASDFSSLPPVLAIAAECDPLADDARLFAEAVVAAGGGADCVTEPGLVHGYLRARHSVTRAKASFQRITGQLAAWGGAAPQR